MNDCMYTSKSCEYETPQSIFNELNSEFHFTLDPCSTHENAKCKKHYTLSDDGLSQDWAGERVFCNPPYGRTIGRWVEKCAKEKALCVMLVPARTDTHWFHDYIYNKAEVRFVKGRLKFGDSKNSAPFPSMIVVFGDGKVDFK